MKNQQEHVQPLSADFRKVHYTFDFVIAYFAWRVITGLNHQITYLMQEVGHTRCLIEAGFVRAKKLFRRTDYDSIAELKQVFDHSSSTNKSELFDNGEDSFT